MPEIYNDELFYVIKDCVRDFKPKIILEIGSWDGTGSTQAFIQSIQENKIEASLYCLEAQKDRYNKLVENTKHLSFVKCYYRLSGTIKDLRSEKEISDFMDRYPYLIISQNTKEKVIGWRKQEDVWPVGVPDDGIKVIKEENSIDKFDMVLLDGSEFTGVADFRMVRNSDVFIMDDINAMKNFENYLELNSDSNFELLKENWKYRNGYAIFWRK